MFIKLMGTLWSLSIKYNIFYRELCNRTVKTLNYGIEVKCLLLSIFSFLEQ